MWLDNLKELRIKAGNPSIKIMAEKSGLPERTVSRMFTGEIKMPYADTLQRITNALGGSLDEILSDTKVVVGEETLIELKEQVETVIADLDNVSAEHDMAVAENSILKTKIAALTTENDMLRMKLEHKEEIIALHNYYMKKQTDI